MNPFISQRRPSIANISNESYLDKLKNEISNINKELIQRRVNHEIREDFINKYKKEITSSNFFQVENQAHNVSSNEEEFNFTNHFRNKKNGSKKGTDTQAHQKKVYYHKENHVKIKNKSKDFQSKSDLNNKNSNMLLKQYTLNEKYQDNKIITPKNNTQNLKSHYSKKSANAQSNILHTNTSSNTYSYMYKLSILLLEIFII